MAQGHGHRQTNYIVDTQLILKTAGLIAASANGAVILDLGGGGQFAADGTTVIAPFIRADMIVDVSAIELDTTDEAYTIILEGSNSATFASGVEPLAVLPLGAAAAALYLGNVDVDSDVGRYVVPFTNLRNETTYRYVRLRTHVGGTVATGINFVAGLTKACSY